MIPPSLDELLERANAMPTLPEIVRHVMHTLDDDDADTDTRGPRSLSAATSGIVQFLTRSDAAFRLAAAALAVAERHETTGAWPASLDEIRGEFPGGVPLDPYTDAPFVYEVMSDTVRIASIGRLPQDDPIDDATLRERGHLWEFRR